MDDPSAFAGDAAGDPAKGDGGPSRSELVRAWEQVTRARIQSTEAELAVAASREMRMDLARRMDVLRRKHEAMLTRQDRIRADSARLLDRPNRTIVIAHRQDWFVGKIVPALATAGITTVAAVTDGADAVGVTVAEQPNLLLIERRLPMMDGLEVLREVVAHAPATLVTTQAAYDEETNALLAAGARTVFSRRVPPVDVAREIAALTIA